MKMSMLFGLSIDPTKDIYKFGHFSDKLLYSINKGHRHYSVFFKKIGFHPTEWYGCDQISVSLKREPGIQISLNKYAVSWIYGEYKDFSCFSDKSFESEDFLEQLCIAFLLKKVRVQMDLNSYVVSYGMELSVKERIIQDENEKILECFLKAFKPNLRQLSKDFSKKKLLSQKDVYSHALDFLSRAITGERQSIIKESIDFYKENPKEKQSARSLNREFRTTPWKTQGHGLPKTDVKSTAKKIYDKELRYYQTLESKLSAETNPGGLSFWNFAISILATGFKKNGVSDLVNTYVSNSERFYTPNSRCSFPGFVFGSSRGVMRSRIWFYLSDLNKRSRKENSCGEEDLEKANFSQGIEREYRNPPRYWRKRQDLQNMKKEEKSQLFSSLKTICSDTEIKTVEKWTSYGKMTLSERKRLERVRKKILENNLSVEI